MSYTSSATTSLGLSSHEVIFSRPVRFAIDQSLATPEAVASSPQAYATDIEPKLENSHIVGHAKRMRMRRKHRIRANENTTEPPFKIGDQVLRNNPVRRKNDSAKLIIQYVGSYLVTDVDERRNYGSQLLSTRKGFSRAVHASRPRPLFQLDNDNRIQQWKPQPAAFEVKTNIRRLQIEIRVGNPLHQEVDAPAVFVNEQLQPIGEVSRLILEAAGPEIQQAYTGYEDKLPPQGVIVTPAGRLTSARQVLRAIGDRSVPDAITA
jgi:hypothetical protein